MKTQICTCCKRPYLMFEFKVSELVMSDECSRCRAIEKKVRQDKYGVATSRGITPKPWEPMKQEFQRGDSKHVKSFGVGC